MKDKNLCAMTPPMGWNSFDCYGDYSEEKGVLENACLVAEKLKSHGYEYVVVDIGWSRPMTEENMVLSHFPLLTLDQYGRQLPAVDRFPSAEGGKGFGPLAGRIHDMGLKFGIHIMRGIPRQAVHAHLPVLGTKVTADRVAKRNSICKWFPDMYGVQGTPDGQAYYDSIFALYAEWGVDFVKVDDICNTNAYPDDPYSAADEIEMIRHAIDHSGRDMVLSLSPGPAVVEQAWHMSQNANMWRITDDLWDRWDHLLNMFDRCEKWQNFVKPGCWPDCDMLPFGKVGSPYWFWNQPHYTNFTHDEQKTLMNLWCIFRSPLMVGANLPENDEFTWELLTNDELLHLTLASHGAHQIRFCRGITAKFIEAFDYPSAPKKNVVWMTEDEENRPYVGIFNLEDTPEQVEVTFDELGLTDSFELYDLWKHQIVGAENQKIKVLLPAHASVVYRLEKQK